MKKKLKIMAASDIEGDSGLVKKLAEKAEKEDVDLVILCGDILGRIETKNLIKPFKNKNKRVLIIPGNHDSFAQIEALSYEYNIRNLHGYAVVYNDLGIFGVGGTTDLISGGFISEKDLFGTLNKAHSRLKDIKKKIMITHMHPEDSLSEVSGISGSRAIKKAVLKFRPDFLIHGHIHEAAGFYEKVGKTKIINAGKRGVIIDL